MVEWKIILEKYVIFGKNNYWTCRSCQHNSNGHPNRMIAHLTRNPGKGIKICPKISPKEMEELKGELCLGTQIPQQHGEKDDGTQGKGTKKRKATIGSGTSGRDQRETEMSLLGALKSSSALGESIFVSDENIWSFENLEKSVGLTGSPLDNTEQNYSISDFDLISYRPETWKAPMMALPETSQETNAVGSSELFNIIYLGQSSSQGRVDHRNDQHTHRYTSTRRNAHGVEMTSEILVSDETQPICIPVFHPCSENIERDVEEDEKRIAQLMRNRESKHRVEELEQEIWNMHSTIAELNSKISFIMSEMVSLRQQLGGGGGKPVSKANAFACDQCTVTSLTELQRHSGVPSITRREIGLPSGSRIKKVASVCFLGPLFFVLLFRGLVPMVDVKLGGIRDRIYRGSGYLKDELHDYNREKVLNFQVHRHGFSHDMERADIGRILGCKNGLSCDRGYSGESDLKPVGGSGGSVPTDSSSEPLVASLFVPRNDELAEMDGNLTIHSVLADENANASLGNLEVKDTLKW